MMDGISGAGTSEVQFEKQVPQEDPLLVLNTLLKLGRIITCRLERTARRGGLSSLSST